MKRDIYDSLKAWKSSDRRKPLLLRGARQVGKTYIVKEFGGREYRKLHYFNFEEDSNISQFFSKDLIPRKIIERLSIYTKSEILPNDDLIFFDEIQESNDAVNSLKYFNEDANEYHIIAAGSLLGVRLSVPKNFPVGKVNFLDLYPMTFSEFLDAIGEERYRGYLEGIDSLEPVPIPFHEELLELLRKYYFVGGMPEVVDYYSQKRDLLSVRSIHKEILDSYSSDFAKHAPASDIPKINLIWNALPLQLAKENKKFIFSALKESARAREYEDAIHWLEGAGLINLSFMTNSVKHPLKGYMNPHAFKVFCLDTGLLGAMSNVPVEILVKGDALFNEYEGTFVENYVAQNLKAMGDKELFYWRNDGRMAEIDFLYEHMGSIYPLEVKSGINVKSKSMHSYDEKYKPSLMIRTTLLNLKKDGKILNIPLYAFSCLPDLLKLI